MRAHVRASLGRPITIGLLWHSIATENSLSRQKRLALCRDRGFDVATRFWAVKSCVCRDIDFCVATMALYYETGVYCDKVWWVVLRHESWSRHNLGVATELDLWVML